MRLNSELSACQKLMHQYKLHQDEVLCRDFGGLEWPCKPAICPDTSHVDFIDAEQDEALTGTEHTIAQYNIR